MLLLTAGVLFFPVRLVSEYHAIQAPYLFDDLPVFGTLFCGWLLLLFLLVFSKRDGGGWLDWETLASACIFGLVFLGFWVFITSYGSHGDDIFNSGHVKWLVDQGTIPRGHANLMYFEFPGMHLLASSLCQMSSLSVFESRTVFLMINAALFSGLLYVLFSKILGSNRYAFLCVALTMMSSVMLVKKMHIFTPGAMGFTLFAALLICVAKRHTASPDTSSPQRWLMIALFAGMVVSYFATSFLLPLILLGLLGIAVLGRYESAVPRLTTIALLLVMLVAWQLCWSWFIFDTLTSFLPKVGEHILSGGFLEAPLTLGESNVGARLPLWASLSRAWWWAVLGLGTLLGLRNLLRIRGLRPHERLVTGGLLGVLMLTAVGVFGTEGGFQFTRFLLYAPLFCVPLLLIFFRGGGAWRARVLGALVIMVLLLGFPTFVSSVNTVSTDAVYEWQCSAGQFVASNCSAGGQNEIVYSLTSASRTWAYYYVPDVDMRRANEKTYYLARPDEVWVQTDDLVSDFRSGWSLPSKQKLFVLSDKDTALYAHLIGVGADDPRWRQIREELGKESVVFENGYTLIYAAER